MRTQLLLIVTAVICLPSLKAEDPVFSGPQVGEELVSFEAKTVFGDRAGSKVDVFGDDRDGPSLLVFVHEVTRPSVGLTRLLLQYADSKAEQGLNAKLVFLTKDPTETEAFLKRARHALPKHVEPLISVDGLEGPGAYGLDRDMTLTILVANEGIVTGNFALIQPSIEADLLKITASVSTTLGETNPPKSLQELGVKDPRMMAANQRRRGERSRSNPDQDGLYRQMISPVISKGASENEVEEAAKKLEQYASEHAWFKQRVHKAANLIIDGGKLANYGTKHAQSYLRKWSTEFAPDADETTGDTTGDATGNSVDER